MRLLPNAEVCEEVACAYYSTANSNKWYVLLNYEFQ